MVEELLSVCMWGVYIYVWTVRGLERDCTSLRGYINTSGTRAVGMSLFVVVCEPEKVGRGRGVLSV